MEPELPGDRLDSWKDIASYLQRDVSTVQRWEKREGMPVHRHVHEKLGSVYAFRSELDAWRARSPSSAQQSQPEIAETAATAAPPPARYTRSILVGVAVVALIATAVFLLRFGRTTGTSADIRSLAVLPLDSLAGDPSQEYLADGITDALISELGKIESLRVTARSAVMKYKGAHAAPRDVARELDVQVIAGGSILRADDVIRITARLIDPASGREMWSESFDRGLEDVLMLQREVTAAIADQVRARLPLAQRSAAVRPVNPAAYDALLRAQYLSVRTTDADSLAAIALLERAIGLDHGFAPAYAALAAAHVMRLAYVAPDETKELEQKAFAAAEKALSLDPNLPEAYLARGDLLWSHSHRFAHERAVNEFRRALALNPNSDQAHRRLARVYVHVGFFEEALQHAAIALALNPSDAQALNSRAQGTLWSGKDEEALTILLSIPGPVLPELVEANTAFALFRLGRRDEAALHLGRAIRKYPDDTSGNLPAMQALLSADSDPRSADELIGTVGRRKALNPSHHAAYFAAAASARMRRPAEAIEWLREAADTGFPCYPLFANDPNLDPIRQDRPFVAFMTEMQKRSTALRISLFSDRK